jgi:DNA-binding CsgD family transcriptional regulator/tetratricopeptide (TPR) repeat protein
MIFDKSVLCPVLIGRANDLQRLDQLLTQAQGGKGQIALISGEAGIGKSRLIREAKEKASERAVILEGYCFQTESLLPYAPFLDLFRNFFETRSREEIAYLMEASAPQLGKLFPELALYLPDLTPSKMPDLDPEQEKRRLFQALAQTLTDLAGRQPLIIIIEDLHWSDSTSLEFLLLLARRIASQPMLLLLTYRSDETTPELTHFLAELDRERLGMEFLLKPMSPPDVEDMLQAILGASQVPIIKEFLDILFPLSEGNPFFIEEILKALSAEGNISYIDGAWDRKEINLLHIPRTIQDAVQRRTQQLDEGTLQALTLASVTGRRFDFRLLHDLLQVQEADLMVMLKELIAAQLVTEETADNFAFRHALTREAVYTTLLLRERQALHRRVGEAMEHLYADSIHLHLADLSYHYYTGGLWQKAFNYSQKAGEQARKLYSQREAVVYYSRALVAARHLHIAGESELLSARGHAYEILGDFKSALEDFEHARRIAQEQQNGQAEWQTLMDLGFLWQGRDYQRTGEFFRQAEELARKLNDTKLHAISLNRLGNWFVNVGQTTQGLEAHRQALAIFEQNDDQQSIAETRDLLGMATLQHGDQIGSYAHYQHAIQLFRNLEDKPGLISALTVASTTSYWDETDFVPAQSHAENEEMAMEALKLARQMRWAAGEAFLAWTMARGLATRGRFGEALFSASEALRIATEIEHRQWITGAHYILGYVYVLLLQPDPAIHNLRQALTLARELGSAWWMGHVTTDLVYAYLLKADLESARSLLGGVFQDKAGHYSLVERRMLWARGNLLLAEGKPAEALGIAEYLLDSKQSSQLMQPIPALLKLNGEALMHMKQWKKAERSLEGAKQGAEEREALPLLWQIHARLGWLYKAQKDFEKSEREFASARLVIDRLGANVQEESLRTDFVQATLRNLPTGQIPSKRRREAETFGGLTPREREVARLVAEGKSNREIAETLVLSERTAENHISNILMKLGFTSRAQVAVWAVDKGLGASEKN